MYATMNKSNVDSFAWVDWMVAERDKQGLSQADLARKSHLSRAAISDYEKRMRRNPDINALVSISVALGYPPEHLPRIAGILPPASEPVSDEIEAIVHEASKLNDQDKAEVLAFIRMKINLRKRQSG